MTAPRIEPAPFSDGAWWLRTPDYTDHWEPVFLERHTVPVWISRAASIDTCEYRIVSSWGNYGESDARRVGYSGHVFVDGKWIDAMWAKLIEPE